MLFDDRSHVLLIEEREEEVSQQRKRMITELEQRMVKATETSNLFVIKFKVK